MLPEVVRMENLKVETIDSLIKAFGNQLMDATEAKIDHLQEVVVVEIEGKEEEYFFTGDYDDRGNSIHELHPVRYVAYICVSYNVFMDIVTV